MRRRSLAAVMLLATMAAATPFAADAQNGDSVYDERPAKLASPTEGSDYERRVVDIPMRDGIKLHTVIMIPKGAKDAPILMTRTPYSADQLTANQHSGTMATALDGYDNATDVIVAGGYIRVVQDVRGKYGSGGIAMMNPPLAGTALNPTKTDDSTRQLRHDRLAGEASARIQRQGRRARHLLRRFPGADAADPSASACRWWRSSRRRAPRRAAPQWLSVARPQEPCRAVGMTPGLRHGRRGPPALPGRSR